MRHVTSATPVVLSGALVIPAGLLRTLRGEPILGGSAFSTNPEARSRIEQLAMNAVHLAIVLVGEDDSIDGPHFVPRPFKEEPGWGVSSVNYDLNALLERAEKAGN